MPGKDLKAICTNYFKILQSQRAQNNTRRTQDNKSSVSDEIDPIEMKIESEKLLAQCGRKKKHRH